jgi:O-methyltransferase
MERIKMPILPPFIGKPAVSAARKFFQLFGFELVDMHIESNIPDAKHYRPMFAPWTMPDLRDRIKSDDDNSLLSLNARYNLYALASASALASQSDFAECGVYKGGTAKILAEIAGERPIYLFDTFSGMPETDPSKDLHRAGDFADTSLEAVQRYLSANKNAVCIPGFIPDSLRPCLNKRFSFVHIDLDIYSAISAASEFFYPRLDKGAVMLFDDYGFPSCPGARLAIDEFFSDKPETPIVLNTAQAFITKL